MSVMQRGGLSRRSLLKGAGSLVVAFSIEPTWAEAQSETQAPTAGAAPDLPGSLKTAPKLDAWIRVDADGHVTAFTGKAELGQGIRTALTQLAAEELRIPFESVELVTPDTARTPNEGFTAGSHSIQDSGSAIRNAAAQVREILIGQAARRLNVPVEQLRAENGFVVGSDGTKLGYGELVAADVLHVDAQPKSVLTLPPDYREIGHPRRRVDIPGKVTGGLAYVQDMRPEGLLHGRIVRPPSPGARLTDVDQSVATGMPGVVKVVRNGSFLAVLARKEYQAVKAMRALGAAARWQEKAGLPDIRNLPAVLMALPTQDGVVKDARRPVSGGQIAGGHVYAALSGAWLDRAVMRRRGARRRCHQRLDSYPGRLSRSEGDRADAGCAARQGALHPCRGIGMLRA